MLRRAVFCVKALLVSCLCNVRGRNVQGVRSTFAHSYLSVVRFFCNVIDRLQSNVRGYAVSGSSPVLVAVWGCLCACSKVDVHCFSR